MDGHAPVETPEGWVDCECGWTCPHNRLPSDAEAAAAKAVAEFDATVAPAMPPRPDFVVLPGAPLSPSQVVLVETYNAWQEAWGGRVRPLEPHESTGDPDPASLGDGPHAVHLVDVERDALIEEHLASKDGTLLNLPADIALLGVEPLVGERA